LNLALPVALFYNLPQIKVEVAIVLRVTTQSSHGCSSLIRRFLEPGRKLFERYSMLRGIGLLL
jgi:hypothetical protein